MTILYIIFPATQADDQTGVVLLWFHPPEMSLELFLLAGTKYHMQKSTIRNIYHIFSYIPSRRSRSVSRNDVVLRQFNQMNMIIKPMMGNSQIMATCHILSALMNWMEMLCLIFNLMHHDLR